MTISYRKRKGRRVWHFCIDCSRWPTKDYESRLITPPTTEIGGLCKECLAKNTAGSYR